MKSKRILSLALSLLMIAGLLTAFPAFTASAANTNLALGKKYAYSEAPDNTVGSGDDYAFCEKTQDEAGVYHTGYLTDGTKPQIRAGFYANPGWLGYVMYKVENVSFTVDLENEYDISSVEVFLSWDNPPEKLASQPSKLEVSYSADGTTFSSAEEIKDKYDTVPLYQKDLTTEYTKGHTHTASNAVSGVRYVKVTISVPFEKNDAGQYTGRLYIGEIVVNGEKASTDTDVSKGKKYAYSLAPDNTIYSGSDYAFCETTQDAENVYHTGFLTDGTKPQVRAGFYANPGWLGYLNKVDNVSFTVDLENKYDISSVAVFLSWDDPPARLASKPTKLEVTYSADGKTFDSAESIIEKYDTVPLYQKDLVTEYTKGHTHTTENAVSGIRYVKITASTPFEKNDAGQYVCRLYIGEITVTGAPSEGSTDQKLAAPAVSITGLSSNHKNQYGRYSTYTIPTISWTPVENATG
ncbi:MAG: hypothetical protein IJS94_06120, partial [Clostridia bacterium]|nr:hypothetical protein [Clostridia bacterium]